MSMKYKEIEFKYNANNINFQDFVTFCDKRDYNKKFYASGHDHFYQNIKNQDAFCRHRTGSELFNQLTFKSKTVNNNNYIRTERNIDLSPKMSQPDVEGLCNEFGYKYKFSLFKNCFIYLFDYYTLVYYICYDDNMNETGRFVELEMNEDYPWTSEAEAMSELIATERLCKSLGISPQSRIKKSLFEIYGDKK